MVDLRGYLGVGHGAGAVPRDAGLALLLLAGAQGTLSRQHNLWAEMGAQGDASARDAPRGCFTECHHCTEVCSEESTALAPGWFVLADGRSRRAEAKTNARRGAEPG